MKNGYIILLLLLGAVGCNLLDNDLPMGRPRSYYQRTGGNSDGLKNNKSPGLSDPMSPQVDLTPDTVVFVSAVRYPPEYDWRKDTDFSCRSAELLLFRNGETVVSIPVTEGSGISTAPDMHHILDGHLYTEFCDYRRTVFGRDGVELFSVDGRELMRGILEKDEDLYMLTQNLSAGGFIFRKNGSVVLSKPRGEIIGKFDDPSYGSTGALYLDDEKVCFAYRVNDEGTVKWYMVRDGDVELVSDAGRYTLDLKSVAGENVAISTSSLGQRWKDARIWRNGALYSVAGEIDETGETLLRVVESKTLYSSSVRLSGGLIYVADGLWKVLDQEAMGNGSYCFLPRCACMMGSELLKAWTPRNGDCPYLEVGEERIMFEGIDGPLTGVTATISYPKIQLLPRPQR